MKSYQRAIDATAPAGIIYETTGSMQAFEPVERTKEMLLVLLGISVAGFCAFAVTYSTPHALNVGDVYELRRDGWSDSPGGQG